MQKTLSFFALLLAVTFTIPAIAQADKMYKHNGQVADVKIIKVGEFTITYSYANEIATQVISKYAVAKIVYASGRTEEMTEKIMVGGGKDDWEKVAFLEDKLCIVGLEKVGEIRVASYGFTTGYSDKRATKKIKTAAAAKGGQFIYIYSEKDNEFSGEAVRRAGIYSY